MLGEILATEPAVYPEFAHPAMVTEGFIEQLFRFLSLWSIMMKRFLPLVLLAASYPASAAKPADRTV